MAEEVFYYLVPTEKIIEITKKQISFINLALSGNGKWTRPSLNSEQSIKDFEDNTRTKC